MLSAHQLLIVSLERNHFEMKLMAVNYQIHTHPPPPPPVPIYINTATTLSAINICHFVIVSQLLSVPL